MGAESAERELKLDSGIRLNTLTAVLLSLLRNRSVYGKQVTGSRRLLFLAGMQPGALPENDVKTG